MARQAKLKAGTQVRYLGSIYNTTVDQYLYCGKQVVNLVSHDGLIKLSKIQIELLEVPVKAEPEPITNSIFCGSATQVADTSVLNSNHVKTVDKTLDERGNRYGDFTNHAEIAQELQDTMRNHQHPNQLGELVRPWVYLSAVQKQALTVMADKIARILNGDPNYADNWHDIQGYAKLVEDRLPKAE